MKKKFFLVLLGVIVIALLSACGRMNAPVKPEDSIYPRTYY